MVRNRTKKDKIIMAEKSLKDLIVCINATDKMIGDLYHSYSASKNISDSASMILYSLRLSDKPLTQSELCSMIYLSKQTANSSLKKLEKEGYVVFCRAENSKKSKIVSLTESGKGLAERTVDKIIEKEIAALKTFPENKVIEFVSLYGLYAAALKAEFLKG